MCMKARDYSVIITAQMNEYSTRVDARACHFYAFGDWRSHKAVTAARAWPWPTCNNVLQAVMNIEKLKKYHD